MTRGQPVSDVSTKSGVSTNNQQPSEQLSCNDNTNDPIVKDHGKWKLDRFAGKKLFHRDISLAGLAKILRGIRSPTGLDLFRSPTGMIAWCMPLNQHEHT